jgi:hypothetical protein
MVQVPFRHSSALLIFPPHADAAPVSARAGKAGLTLLTLVVRVAELTLAEQRAHRSGGRGGTGGGGGGRRQRHCFGALSIVAAETRATLLTLIVRAGLALAK